MSGPISSLIDGAPPGSRVVIPAGMHEEAIVLSKPVTLVAERPKETTIRAPAAMTALSVQAEADISGIRFEGSEGVTTAVDITASTFMMECEVHGGGTGIRVAGTGVIARIEYGFLTDSIRSIAIEDGAGCDLTDVDLTPWGPLTFQVDSGSALRATRCHFASPDAGGGRVLNQSCVGFFECLFDRVPANGRSHNREMTALVIVSSGSHARLARSTVQGGAKTGVIFSEATGRLFDVTVMGNALNGVHILNGSKVAMAKCFLSGNGQTGVVAASGSKAGLRAVSAKGNGAAGLFVDSGSLLRARDCTDITGNDFGVCVGEAAMRLRRCDLRGNINGPIRSHPACDFQAVDTPMHGRKGA